MGDPPVETGQPGRRFDFPESPLTPPSTETERWLYSLTRFGMKPGLANIQALAARFGDPQRSLRFLHVAGTNGKGSVCLMLERQLRAAGYSTGLFTSPHLLHVGERLRVDGVALDDAGVGALVERVAPAVSEREATFFEAITLMGLLHFAERGVDWVLWETGLGGRLDSTRIAAAEAALVTRRVAGPQPLPGQRPGGDRPREAGHRPAGAAAVLGDRAAGAARGGAGDGGDRRASSWWSGMWHWPGDSRARAGG